MSLICVVNNNCINNKNNLNFFDLNKYRVQNKQQKLRRKILITLTINIAGKQSVKLFCNY